MTDHHLNPQNAINSKIYLIECSDSELINMGRFDKVTFSLKSKPTCTIDAIVDVWVIYENLLQVTDYGFYFQIIH